MHKHALGKKSFDLRVSHLRAGWHCPQIGYSATLEALRAKLSTTCSSTSPRINKRVDSFVRLGLRPVMREKLPPKTGVERLKHISSKLEYHFAKWVSPSSIGSILEIGASSLLAMALYRSSSETVQKHSKANRSIGQSHGFSTTQVDKLKTHTPISSHLAIRISTKTTLW